MIITYTFIAVVAATAAAAAARFIIRKANRAHSYKTRCVKRNNTAGALAAMPSRQLRLSVDISVEILRHSLHTLD